MAPGWSAERRHDPYYRAAQREGLRSRAAFKLLYLQEKFHLLHEGDRVLDLGASPGGWSLVARELVGPRGEVVSVDMRNFEPSPGVRFVRGRVGDPALRPRLGPEPFDRVLSDMAPSLSGNYATDHARSVELAELALGLAREVLRPKGTLAVKVFQGDLTAELRAQMAEDFQRVDATKPPASREASSEMYLVARGFLGDYEPGREPVTPQDGEPGRTPGPSRSGRAPGRADVR